jgi:integrase
MARGIERLTPRQVEAAKRDGFISDGGGLYLQIRGQAKSWIFQYVDSYGKVRNMGLGSVNAVSLDEARAKARECRSQRQAGIDPMAARDKVEEARKLAASKEKTFRDCAEAWMARSRWSPGRANNVAYWFRKYAYPKLGHLPIQQFDIRQDNTGVHLVASVVLPLWEKKFTTAKQLQENIEATLNWAMADGCLSTGPNAADYNGQLGQLLPQITHEVTHHAALPYKQVGEFMVKLRAHRDAGNRKPGVVVDRKNDKCKVCSSPRLDEINAARRTGATFKALEKRFGIGWNTFFHHYHVHDPETVDLNTTRREKAAWAIELTVLTAVRKGQAIAAKWSEIDLENGIWRCSQHKTRKKTKQDYVVPLSKQAKAVLETMKAYQKANGIESDYVFPGSMGGKNPLSRTACNKFLRVSLGYPKDAVTVHGFRRTFGDWSVDETEFDERDSEMALGHTIGSTVRNIYKRNAKRIDQRRLLMQAWADFCDRTEPLPAKVIDGTRRFLKAK